MATKPRIKRKQKAVESFGMPSLLTVREIKRAVPGITLKQAKIVAEMISRAYDEGQTMMEND